MVAVVRLCAVILTTVFLTSGTEAEPWRMSVYGSRALATTTEVARTDRALSTTPEPADDSESKLFYELVKDGISMAESALNVAKWPMDLALALHGSTLSQISAFITWFTFLTSFVIPGGTGASFLSWLRGDPAKMSRGRALRDSVGLGGLVNWSSQSGRGTPRIVQSRK